MDAITQRYAMGDLLGRETARFFVAAGFDALECLTATFTTHSYAPHRHETYVVGTISAGCETWTARGARHYAGPGDFCFNDPEVVHDGASFGPGFSYRMTYPSVALMRRIAAEVSGTDSDATPSFPASMVRDPEGAVLFEAAHRALQADGDPLAAEELTIRALAHCLVRHAAVAPRRVGCECDGIARARRRIEEDYARPLALEALAGEAGLSRHHFIRAFRKQTGLTPHAFLVDRRVLAARDRLRRGEAPAAVADAVGFADQAHLTRAFKARLAVTPGAYRAAFRA